MKICPGFVTISPPIQFGSQNYGSAFLPAVYQGTRIGAQRGDDAGSSHVSDMHNPDLPTELQRKQLDLVQAMNRDLLSASPNREIEGVIESFELGFKMQGELPRVLDYVEGITRDAQTLRHRRARDGQLRQTMFDGAPPFRRRRAIRRGLPRRLGSAQQPASPPQGEWRRD
jgi:hypothetical protein